MRRYAEEAGDKVTVEGALHAWIDTDLNVQLEDPEQWAAFGKIAAQANSAAGWGAEKMTKYFNPVVLALIDLLKKAMPDCDEETIFWGYHFVSGAMTHNMARTGRLDELSHGLCSSSDFESIRRHMAKFMAAGFQAICLASKATQEKKVGDMETARSRDEALCMGRAGAVVLRLCPEFPGPAIAVDPGQADPGRAWASATGSSDASAGCISRCSIAFSAFRSRGSPIVAIESECSHSPALSGVRPPSPAAWRRTIHNSSSHG